MAVVGAGQVTGYIDDNPVPHAHLAVTRRVTGGTAKISYTKLEEGGCILGVVRVG